MENYLDFYPHTTVVKKNVKLRRTRVLPVDGEVVLRIGQATNAETVVARAVRDASLYIVNAHEQLPDVNPKNIAKHIIPKIGTPIEKDKTRLLRQKKGWWGKPKAILAKHDGILREIRNGYLIISSRNQEVNLRAMIAGQVTKVIPNRGVEIEVAGSIVQGVWSSAEQKKDKLSSIGRDASGIIKLLTQSPSAIPTEASLESSRGNLVVAGHLDNPHLVEVAEKFSVAGFIVGSVTAAVLDAAAKFRIPVLVTDGFGQKMMNAPAFNLFKELDGRAACILGDTVNGNRPEVIIPDPNIASSTQLLEEEEFLLEPDQRVRLIGTEFDGLIGRVLHIHHRPTLSPIGIYTTGAEVSVKDGQVVFVPLANLDIII